MEQKLQPLSERRSEAERIVPRLGATKDPAPRERGPVAAPAPLPCPGSSRLSRFQRRRDVLVRVGSDGLVTWWWNCRSSVTASRASVDAVLFRTARCSRGSDPAGGKTRARRSSELLPQRLQRLLTLKIHPFLMLCLLTQPFSSTNIGLSASCQRPIPNQQCHRIPVKHQAPSVCISKWKCLLNGTTRTPALLPKGRTLPILSCIQVEKLLDGL